MSDAAPVVLILGAGSNVGEHVAKAFGAKGYKVARVSRKPREQDSTPDSVFVSADLSDPESAVAVFSKAEASLGLPSVVIYNAAAVTPTAPNDPFSLPLADFKRDQNINTTSVFAAAQQAILAFRRLPASASKTFIYTGNLLNTNVTIPPLMDLGVGKSASAHMIKAAAAAYKEAGLKFYYADERNVDGSAAFKEIDGEAHGTHYLHLAEGKSQGPWQQTFVKGIGYKDFSSI